MKAVDAIFVIIGIIALLGSLFAAFVFVQVGATISQASHLGSLVTAEMQQGLSMFNTMLILGWIWVVCVFLSSLYTIWSGIQRIRTKKK